jgi:four helix bundle protein
MGVKRVEDLVVFQLAVEFKLEIYRLLDTCRTPMDFRYQSQLRSAASDIEANLNEGFTRNVSGEFFQFVRYARASLAEAQRRLQDGVHRHYFGEADCRPALAIAKRCGDAATRR